MLVSITLLRRQMKICLLSNVILHNLFQQANGVSTNKTNFSNFFPVSDCITNPNSQQTNVTQTSNSISELNYLQITHRISNMITILKSFNADWKYVQTFTLVQIFQKRSHSPLPHTPTIKHCLQITPLNNYKPSLYNTYGIFETP